MLLETVLDGKYAGFYDLPLLSDYAEIAKIYIQLGQTDMAEEYINRILAALEKHMIEAEKENKSRILYSTALQNSASIDKLCKILLQNMINTSGFERFKVKIADLLKKYEEYIC